MNVHLDSIVTHIYILLGQTNDHIASVRSHVGILLWLLGLDYGRDGRRSAEVPFRVRAERIMSAAYATSDYKRSCEEDG